MNKQVTNLNFAGLLKKYGYIAVLTVMFVATAIIIAVTVNSGVKPGTKPTDGGSISFGKPILNATVAKEYSDTELMYNSTLKQWEAHKAITFTVPSGADVYAVLDGKVVDVYSNYLEGNVIVIEHKGGFQSVYGSLADGATLKKGDTVVKGAVIGQASTTATAEYNLGNHLRFELKENNIRINPTSYLNLEAK